MFSVKDLRQEIVDSKYPNYTELQDAVKWVKENSLVGKSNYLNIGNNWLATINCNCIVLETF